MTTRTLERWRKAFPDEWPRLVDGQHSVAAWRQFALDRNLRPSYEWQPKALTTAAPARKPAADRAPVLSAPWYDARTVIFEAMDFLHDAYLDGAIDLRTFCKLAIPTLDQLCALAKLWAVSDFDPFGWRKNWWSVIAEEILKKDEGQGRRFDRDVRNK